MLYPYFYVKKPPERKSIGRGISKRKLAGGFSIVIGVFTALFLVAFPLYNSFFGQAYGSYIASAVGEDFLNEPGNITALDFSKNLSRKKFVLGEKTSVREKKPSVFSMDIPSLGIRNALVEADSTNLDPTESLVHILGTERPGSSGNVFITGHSTFKYLFDPSDYKTIFSRLDELESGDEIVIKYDNDTFRYSVIQKEILDPDKVSLYEEYYPKFLNKQTLTLMTCFPGGTTKYRLLVVAELVE